MSQSEAVQAVTDVLKEVQELSGRPAGAIDESTKPIGDLDGFDSLCGVEAAGILCGKFGVELVGTNPFVDPSGMRARTVGEVASAVRESAAAGVE